MSTSPTIDTTFVQRWSAEYPPNADNKVLGEVHPAVQQQGHYTKSDAEVVVRWKSRRSTGYLRDNPDADIRAISEMALAGPPHLAHRVLGVLHGVGVPVASAMLMVYAPDRFTVIDRYAIHALRHHGEWTDRKRWPSYPHYVELCSDLARRCGADLRTLDRALWAWGDSQNG